MTGGINLLDCKDCKKRNPKEKRQMYGCGYETLLPNPKPFPQRDSFTAQVKRSPTVCLGYTRSLPVVTETVWDLVHAEEWHTLSMLYDGLTDEHRERIQVLKLGRGEARMWAMANPPPKDKP